jgi:hypothetical protein
MIYKSCQLTNKAEHILSSRLNVGLKLPRVKTIVVDVLKIEFRAISIGIRTQTLNVAIQNQNNPNKKYYQSITFFILESCYVDSRIMWDT